METSEIYNMVDRYLAGELNTDEKEQLNTRLATDEVFAKTFSEYLAVAYAAEQRR